MRQGELVFAQGRAAWRQGLGRLRQGTVVLAPFVSERLSVLVLTAQQACDGKIFIEIFPVNA